MELSQSIEFNEVFKNKLYYSKYVYKASFILYGARTATFHKNIDSLMDRLNDTDITYYPMNSVTLANINGNIKKLEKFIAWNIKHDNDKSYIMRVQNSSVSVYSNELSLLSTLFEIFDGDVSCITFDKIVETDEIGVKTFIKEPKHKFRIYLKECKLPEDFEKFLKKNETTLFPSLGLVKSLKRGPHVLTMFGWHSRYISTNFFIDYDEENMTSYLKLMYSECFGKKYKLEKRQSNN